jgi:hypothetical protein
LSKGIDKEELHFKKMLNGHMCAMADLRIRGFAGGYRRKIY